MVKMDAKEEVMLQHYKEIIEKRRFDEYDILGFLIFIRRNLDREKYKYILDFANLIAHRERNQGIVYKCILAGKSNNYAISSDGKSVEGYCGLDTNKWNKEWYQLGKDFLLKIDNETIKEITLCIFSLSQNTPYVKSVDDGKSKTNLGTLKLLFGQDKFLYLATSEGKENTPWIIYAKYGQFDFVRENTKFDLRKPVETTRVDGKLRLSDEDGYII